MTCTGEEDKGSAIKGFMSLLVGNLWWKKVTAEQMKLPRCFLGPGREPPSWDSTTGQDQSRQSWGHLLGPNWSLLQLMASCGCVFTSHLLWVLGFPALLQDKVPHQGFPVLTSLCSFIPLLMPSSSLCPCFCLSFLQSARSLAFQELVGSTLQDNAAFLKSLPKTRYHLVNV